MSETPARPRDHARDQSAPSGRLPDRAQLRTKRRDAQPARTLCPRCWVEMPLTGECPTCA